MGDALSDPFVKPIVPKSKALRRSLCSAPLKTGPCRALFPKWGFNAASGQCVPFFYGGCKGNKNNFETQEDCQEMCG